MKKMKLNTDLILKVFKEKIFVTQSVKDKVPKETMINVMQEGLTAKGETLNPALVGSMIARFQKHLSMNLLKDEKGIMCFYGVRLRDSVLSTIPPPIEDLDAAVEKAFLENANDEMKKHKDELKGTVV